MKVSELFKNVYQNYYQQLILFSLILIFAGILETTSLIFLAPIFDNILNNDLSNSSFLTQKIYLFFENYNLELTIEILLLLFILSTLVSSLLSTLCVYFSEKIKFSYGRHLMSITLQNLFSLKWKFFSRVKQGTLLNTINRELQIIISTLSIFARVIANLVQFLIIAILPLMISWKLVLIMFITIIIIFLPFIKVSKYTKKIGDLDTQAHRNFLSILQEILTGLKIVVGNSLQNFSINQILGKYLTLIKVAIIRAVMFAGISNAILPVSAIGFAILYYVSFNFLELTLVELTVVVVSFMRMTSKLGLVVREKSQLDSSLASLRQLNFINKKNKKFIFKNGKNIIKKFSSKIEFKNVNYSYDQKNLVLKNCNIDFIKGNVYGIMGESGSGKTTIIDLIMGFDFPTKGNIKIDNKNIEDLNINQLRKKIGYISQETILFNTSILNNILWTNSNASKKDVEKIINRSKAFNFIKKLPNGLNTLTGDRGASLSGGQIQRISLLRAMIKDPEIIILDEGTSALDIINEKYVIQFLKKFKKVKTIIIVAHKLSALQYSDKIYIINKGNVLKKTTYQILKNINKAKEKKAK
jgi:ABC-type multidrug transport system fused ATPase/permease subunit